MMPGWRMHVSYLSDIARYSLALLCTLFMASYIPIKLPLDIVVVYWSISLSIDETIYRRTAEMVIAISFTYECVDLVLVYESLMKWRCAGYWKI